MGNGGIGGIFFLGVVASVFLQLGNFVWNLRFGSTLDKIHYPLILADLVPHHFLYRDLRFYGVVGVMAD